MATGAGTKAGAGLVRAFGRVRRTLFFIQRCVQAVFTGPAV